MRGALSAIHVSHPTGAVEKLFDLSCDVRPKHRGSLLKRTEIVVVADVVVVQIGAAGSSRLVGHCTTPALAQTTNLETRAPLVVYRTGSTNDDSMKNSVRDNKDLWVVHIF